MSESLPALLIVPLEFAPIWSVSCACFRCSNGGASVRVDFKAGTDMDLAAMEVRDRVDQARGVLPTDLDRVSIWRWQTDQREIMDVSVAWRGAGNRLVDIVRKVIEPRLLRINGVANVGIGGIEEKQLIVELDQEQLESHGVTLPFLAWQVRNRMLEVL